MSDAEYRFQTLRERARALGFDLRVWLGPKLYEGERVISTFPDGSTWEGVAIGDDDSSLATELAIVEGALHGLEVGRA